MEQLLPWFMLRSVSGIGNHLFKRLIERFGAPQRILQSSRDELLAVDGITPRLASAIKNHRLPDAVKSDMALVEKRQINIVTMTDSNYPRLLWQIADPPPFLYVDGQLPTTEACLAVVGSRHATTYGLSTTHRLCRDLAGLGLIIVSGMAVGIDTAAHEGALSGGKSTIAVLGSGLNHIYPRENVRLAQRISENGGVASEFPMASEPDAYHFPMRNRIISGMSLGTLVVEASRRSGSLITARLAADQGREVFAVPGSVHSFKSAGTHVLIKEGAKLVEHAQDIIEDIWPSLQPVCRQMDGTSSFPPSLTADETQVVSVIGPYPIHIDDLARQLQIDAARLTGLLTQLELKGVVHQSPGMYFAVGDDYGHHQK